MLILLLLTYTLSSNPISVSMNKVWPFSNPSETYRYYDFPFCQPEVIYPQFMSFGQIMRGDRLVNSKYPMEFKTNIQKRKICTRKTSSEEIRLFKAAIDENYLFELFVNDLPVIRPFGAKSLETKTLVGETLSPSLRYFLLNTFNFIIGYNENDIVSVNITMSIPDLEEQLVELNPHNDEQYIDYFYSVTWVPLTITSNEALKKQTQMNLILNHGEAIEQDNLDIHWLAIINSFVLMLLILTVLLIVIVRVVKSDLSRYLNIPDEELSVIDEESGWKLLHGDVFRSPKHRIIFCSMIGSGFQLFTMLILMVIVGCISNYYERGAVVTSACLFYMLTSFGAGFVSSLLYRILDGDKWMVNIIVTCGIFTGPAFFIWSLLNTIATFYSSTAAWPFLTVISIIAAWALVTFPLGILGGVAGRHIAIKQSRLSSKNSWFPCKTNRLAREIPRSDWYHSLRVQTVVAGFLPFSSIYIELHYIFNSIWGNKFYTLYGILAVAICMLLLVSSTVSILFCYLQLNAENHMWWWRSFWSGSSVGVFFYIYCLWYFFQSGMSGLLQCSFFFLYSLVVAYGIALLLGFVSFMSTFRFVIYIFSRIKVE